MGADVMRWQFCAQPPNQNLLFGYGPGHEIKRKLLTLWNSVSFFVEYANIQGFRPAFSDLSAEPDTLAPALDRWLAARTRRLVREATDGYEAFLTVSVTRAFDEFVDDLSNWYIRRSRRRFWDGDEVALRALWRALVRGVQVIAPVLPFLAEHLWQNLVSGPCPDAPDSVFLAEWPGVEAPDEDLLAEIDEVRRVVELGRQARAVVGIRLRQPLRRIAVQGASRARAHADEIAAELRVKEVAFDGGPDVRAALRPNLPVLGPRLGPRVADVTAALRAGRYEELPGGGIRVAGEDLAPGDVLRGEPSAPEGWAVAEDGGISVAIDTALDEELIREGRVLDLIRTLNDLRKEAGLELTDRIRVWLPPGDEPLPGEAGRVKEEVLAVAIEVDPGATAPRLERA
jgi:isoleucyl-tRNA synthetase